MGDFKLAQQPYTLDGIKALWYSSPPDAVIGASGKVYQSRSLFCVKPHHFPRRFAIWLLETKFFDPFILLTILCAHLTLSRSCPTGPTRSLDSLRQVQLHHHGLGVTSRPSRHAQGARVPDAT